MAVNFAWITEIFPTQSRWSLLVVLAVSASDAASGAQTHPLDPLTADEVRLTSDLLISAGNVNSQSHLASMHVAEPSKATLLLGSAAPAPPRLASVLIYQLDRRTTYEAIVDLEQLRVASYREVKNRQPSYLPVDWDRVNSLLQRDPRWLAALRRRGVTQADMVQADLWGAGGTPGVAPGGPRIWMAVGWLKGDNKNAYARPLGLTAKVDVTNNEVLEVHDSNVTRPPRPNDYDAAEIGPKRPALKPLVQAQPEGPSFAVEGHWISWDNWRFHYGIHPREGLVLHQVSYRDQRLKNERRSVAYRLSVSEMAVPYGDPDQGWSFRCALDEGDFGLGYCSPHRLGVDVPTYATLLDAVLPLSNGVPLSMPAAVAVYEQFPGLLWKHHTPIEYGVGIEDSRAARQLVISQIVTLGNYDYIFRWIFHQDGVIEQQTLMTGIVLAKAVQAETVVELKSEHATLVDARVAAVHHQHFFNFRLDLDVDGPINNAWEINAEPITDPAANPGGNAFVAKVSPLESESQARRMVHIPSSRHWRMTRMPPRPTGWGILRDSSWRRTATRFPWRVPGSSVRRRASFLDAHLWCTPYSETERYAGGRFVNQSNGDDGLAVWTAQDRPLKDTDLVWWYTLGVTHLPRPEEWPVMTTHVAGFKLKPWGFFDRNPALDAP